MMAQYLEIKARHENAILFYRMGDFYEMFFDDAVAAADALEIALTKRGKHNGEDIPMCGVPFHSAEGYLLALIRKGFRVAVCEQLESPAEAKKRSGKSVVKRDVVRLVTPGTLTEDSLLNARRHNFLACYSEIRAEGALSWADISTGELRLITCNQTRLGPELARLMPSEIIIQDHLSEDLGEVIRELGISITPFPSSLFDSASGEKGLLDTFGVASLDAFGEFNRVDVSALGALVGYLDITQKGNMPLLRTPIRETENRTMQIDAATRRNLELTHSLSGSRKGSLLATIDRTLTAGGGRLLEQRIASPSRDLGTITQRLSLIDQMITATRSTQSLKELLRQVPDLERALSRVALDRAGPRDLVSVRNALTQSISINTVLGEIDGDAALVDLSAKLLGHDALLDLLDDALVAEPPLLARDGGFIATDFDDELDETRALRDEGKSVIAGMQQDFISTTGISSLKIKHNNVLGYFIETPGTHANKMLTEPLNETFIHRQTTANAVRFTTLELSQLETKILNAGARAIEIEKRHYLTLTAAILDASDRLFETAGALAQIDLTTAFADLATGQDWSRPSLTEGREFDIVGGRHPVVEAALRETSGSFVANDCDLSDGKIWLLTGPNMAGKSTFLRQNALIVLLAQIGSYVPASKATIGIVSQLFSRVGASDDLARGRSTFMVEMVETATILNQADEKALVILDEIGRGTATYDGLSIAWATLEHLHETNRSRALFATHYHEMTALSDKLDRVENTTVRVKEWEGDVIFLHEVMRGAADRSYGVQVARLAGLPATVVERAKVVLEALEKGDRDGNNGKKAVIDDLPLFSSTPSPAAKPKGPSEVELKLDQIMPDDLTPKEALALIYEMKELSKDS
jgi:DNA mismatch repair protein MutS